MATFDDIEKKKNAKQVDYVDPIADALAQQDQQPQGNTPDLTAFVQTYAILLQQLRVIKRPVSSAPSTTPRTFFEQIQYYENGSTRRLYIYISGTWRYVALT